jgi:hypothetical protein
MLRRAIATVAIVTVVLVACSEPAATPVTTAPPATTPTTTTTTVADPFSLADLPGAYTVPAAITPRIFSDENSGYSGDLLLDEFTCDAIGEEISFEVLVCAEGGTNDSPFALVIGGEYAERDEENEVATTSLQYAVYRPVATPDGVGVRAEVVMAASEQRKMITFDNVTLAVERVDTAAGRAIALHYTSVPGAGRALNVIEMIGLNQFGSPQVVATYTGEGVTEFADGKGFVYSGYHYADNEALCCASYHQAHYFRPGANGWTHSRLTAPNDPDKLMEEEPTFAGLAPVEIVAIYEYTRGTSD